MAAPVATVMLHSRLLRDLAVTALLGKTLAGDRVYPTPVVPWRRERPLPAIGVYTFAERGVPLGGLGNMGPIQLRQSCELTIEALVEVVTDPALDAEARLRLDTAVPLDQLCAQISVLLSQAFVMDPAWLAAIEGLERWERRYDVPRVDEADRRTIAATLTATLNYTCIAEPVITDKFLTAWFDVDVIDPAADPNVTGHPTEPPAGYPGGYPGPDGRIEVEFHVPPPGAPPLWPPDPPVEEH
jgi:hypothetical protein